MTSYATMRQLQRGGSSLIKGLSFKDKLILTVHGEPLAEVRLRKPARKVKKSRKNALKYAGCYTNIKHNLKMLDNEWE